MANVDEMIVDFIRNNVYFYDKSSKDFKNIYKKKDAWKNFSLNLKKNFNIDMPAKDIERRWSSLRDMFTRECRKKKVVPSESEMENKHVKEWKLYNHMRFLVPHVTHRRKSSFIREIYPVEISEDPFADISASSAVAEEIKVGIPSPLPVSLEVFDEHNYFTQSEKEDRQSESSQHSVQTPLTSPTENTRTRKVPKMDMKRKRIKQRKVVDDISKAAYAITSAVNQMMNHLAEKPKPGYMAAIEEGLKYVPEKKQTECLIEVLKVIQKYEERN